jgi:hypothetical protein
MKQHAAVAAFQQIEAGIPERFGGIRAILAQYDDVTIKIPHLTARRGSSCTNFCVFEICA